MSKALKKDDQYDLGDRMFTWFVVTPCGVIAVGLVAIFGFVAYLHYFK